MATVINREKIHELVKVFYHPTFKTFYVNSRDGETIEKPFGVFISLGITTSIGGLENIRSIIDSNNEYQACLAEISSKKVGTQYINTLVDLENPQQYRIEDPGIKLLGRKEALEELEKMRQTMKDAKSQEILEKYAPLVSKLQHFVNKLDESKGWEDNKIQPDENEGYRIYHMLVNYKKEDNLEYRLGIYVTKKDNEENNS